MNFIRKTIKIMKWIGFIEAKIGQFNRWFGFSIYFEWQFFFYYSVVSTTQTLSKFEGKLWTTCRLLCSILSEFLFLKVSREAWTMSQIMLEMSIKWFRFLAFPLLFHFIAMIRICEVSYLIHLHVNWVKFDFGCSYQQNESITRNIKK